MATKILDLDLAGPTPATVPLDGADSLWLVAWHAESPVGAVVVAPRPGAGEISGEQIEHAVSPLQHAAPDRPLRCASAWPSITVIVCTRDRPDHLPSVLEALDAQTVREFELVIVDNAPRDDRTRRVVEALAPTARYVVEPVPGLPRARNAGIRAASGEVIAFTDDDCRPVRRWIERIAGTFVGMPELGCVTGPILPLELESPAQEAMEARGGFNRGFRRAIYTPDTADGPDSPIQAWKFGAGGNMALTRACLDSLNGFDEALRRSEDLDLFYRTLRAGYCIAFEPGAAVRHRHLPTWPKLARCMFHWGWGYTTYLDKIARTDVAEFARHARSEQRNWLRYQLVERLWPAVWRSADLPFALVLIEIIGGIGGMAGYGLARAAAARRVLRAIAHGPEYRGTTKPAYSHPLADD